MNDVTPSNDRDLDSDVAVEILKARKITRSFLSGSSRLHVLESVDFSVRAGEIVAVLGSSGAGKSTLLHILGALDRPTEGEVWIDGTSIFSLSDDKMAEIRNRAIGFVFQFHHLLPEFTAVENVMMPLLIARHDRREAYTTSANILKDVGLAERLEHKPGELSGGEQQRVAVARALVRRPKVVLADEPSGNLDRANGEALLEMIWQLSRNHGVAFVVVTHDEEIGRRADRMVRLEDGQLVELNQELPV